MAAADSGRRITLRDGRRLGYAGFGDPAGRPLLYCHGFPASRLEAGLLHATAARLGVRVIAPDRPGYGLSDYQGGRTLLDWPDDITQLADALGLARFAVLGVSGGGPYALACAARIPARLTAVGVVCGLGPFDTPAERARMTGFTGAGLALARAAPRLARALFAGAIAPLLRRWPGLSMWSYTVAGPVADREVVRRPPVQALLRAATREAVRQGARGPWRDLVLYTHPWGFRPEDIDSEVRLWHGERDATVPVAVGRDLAQRLRRAHARFVPGEGHFSLPIGHMEEILGGLT